MKKYIRLFIIAGYLLSGISPVYAQIDIDALYGNIYHSGVTSREVKLSRIYAEKVLQNGLKGYRNNMDRSMVYPLKELRDPRISKMMPLPWYEGLQGGGGIDSQRPEPGRIAGLQWAVECHNNEVCGSVFIPLYNVNGKVRFNWDYHRDKWGYRYMQPDVQIGAHGAEAIRESSWRQYASVRLMHGAIAFKNPPNKETIPDVVYRLGISGFEHGMPIYDPQWSYLDASAIPEWWENLHRKVNIGPGPLYLPSEIYEY